MTVRRRTAAIAALTVVLGGAAATATPAFADGTLPPGLYGTKDPAYDGVWRQSLALLAQGTVGVKPAAQSVTWLTGQQCDTGGFASYRPDAAKPCDAKTVLDTNATAAAVQALVALGDHTDTVKKGVSWLKTVQNDDGGWSYNPGGKSDANSTSVVIGALAAAGEKPADTKSAKGGKSPLDALLTFALPCDSTPGAGAFAYQPDLKTAKLYANADASAAAVTAAYGKGLAATAGQADAKGTTCEKAATPEQAAHNGAAYLARTMAKSGHLNSAMPGAESQPDYGNTADAVVALAAAGQKAQAEASLKWLEKNTSGWAKENGPAAYAQLVLAANATGADPREFGGADLVAQLNATGPAPAGTSAAETGKAAKSADSDKKDDSSGMSVWWIVGVFFVASVGVGFLVSARKKNAQK
ncbi:MULTISPECIES: prenyltransferase/squalene oxidase repeat-containing protein [unclassified Streptomyces]|uniref:prenyltransferase/squalene oxidase repeat-containing protein n=1 Tax=unclassified Streptomyces TaxID=2593676 RepID=UPI00340A2792